MTKTEKIELNKEEINLLIASIGTQRETLNIFNSKPHSNDIFQGIREEILQLQKIENKLTDLSLKF